MSSALDAMIDDACRCKKCGAKPFRCEEWCSLAGKLRNWSRIMNKLARETDDADKKKDYKEEAWMFLRSAQLLEQQPSLPISIR